MTNWRRAVWVVLLVAMLAVAAYGIRVQYLTSKYTNPEIARTLIAPYAETLLRGDQVGAYERFTSPVFREAHSWEDYRQGLDRNAAEFGELMAIEPREGDPFQSAGNLFSGRRYLLGGLSYRFRNAVVLVQWEVSKAHGTYKIDATFQEFHERLDPRVF